MDKAMAAGIKQTQAGILFLPLNVDKLLQISELLLHLEMDIII